MFSVHAEDGTYLYAGQGARLLGWEPEDLVGRNPYSFLFKEDLEVIQEGHDGMLEDGEEILFVFRFPRPDEGYTWVQVVSYKAEDTDRIVTVAQTRPTVAQEAAFIKRLRHDEPWAPSRP